MEFIELQKIVNFFDMPEFDTIAKIFLIDCCRFGMFSNYDKLWDVGNIFEKFKWIFQLNLNTMLYYFFEYLT